MLEPFSLLPPGDAQEIPRASINVLEGDATYAQVSLGPLPKGYADTIGNSLRRVLLSSIKGSAVTEVKILDVMHEYSAIPGVKEEVMDLLLNIKRIRIRSPLARSGNGRVGKMRLETQGPGPVCAGDIATSADFEIVNPELHLATLDDASIELSIEFTVEAGKKGYQRAEENQGLSVGVLPVDAIFNPVQKVTHHRNSTRVGDQHDLDNLVLELWTDGTISPVDALAEAADLLVDEFFKFKNLSTAGGGLSDRQSLALSPELYQTPIERLDLSARTLNCLKRAHISRIGEVIDMSDEELLKIRNFGEKSLVELRAKLAERGAAAVAGGQPGYITPALEPPPLAELEDEEDDDEDDESDLLAVGSVATAAGMMGMGGTFAPVPGGLPGDEDYDDYLAETDDDADDEDEED